MKFTTSIFNIKITVKQAKPFSKVYNIKDMIVGYFPDSDTWRQIDEKEYKKIFNHDIAIAYLKTEILESVEREIDQIISGDAAGFYAGLRFLFAEVTYLSHLYWGKNSYKDKKESYYVAIYMRKFKILHPECGVHYEVFRHGLMHSHHPKWLKKGRKIIPWYISNTNKLNSFGICIPEFKEQVKSAIEVFIKELETEKDNNKRNRLDKFLGTLIRVGEILTKKDLGKYARSDFEKIKF